MVTLFLAGDVMTGRGIDQVLDRSVDPALHEDYVKDARRYVALAEAENGPIAAPVGDAYPWGDALNELERIDPHVRIINLETAITTSDDWCRAKGIHYRMHPGNAGVLEAAGIDVCVLGNNHVLDWGPAGLGETLDVLRRRGIRVAGAGRSDVEAATPAAVDVAPRTGAKADGAASSTGTGSPGRIVVHSWAVPSAGVPDSWAAGPDRPGVNLLDGLDAASAERVIERARAHRGDGDRVVVSIHWGPNWGYAIPSARRRFAHRLIDSGAVDVLHGHSSHHPLGMEVYRERLIVYGAGDFLNDYEGISGQEEYRGELTLMYFPELDPSGALRSLVLSPMRIHRFRLRRADEREARWLAERLDRESRKLGTGVELREDGRLEVRAGTG